jgi:hypothetical protein
MDDADFKFFMRSVRWLNGVHHRVSAPRALRDDIEDVTKDREGEQTRVFTFGGEEIATPSRKRRKLMVFGGVGARDYAPAPATASGQPTPCTAPVGSQENPIVL